MNAEGGNIVQVESAADPRLSDYRALKGPERSWGRELFIAEGAEVVRTAITRGRFPLRSVLLTERHLTSGALAEVLPGLPPGVPIFVAPPAVLEAVVGFDVHRGVLAAGDRGPPLDPAELLAAPHASSGHDVVLVLEGISNHDNIGGLFRNAAAFGARGVLLDPRSADPLYRKAIRVSMGHALIVPFARVEVWPDGLEDLARAGYTVVALTPDRAGSGGASPPAALRSPSARCAVALAGLLRDPSSARGIGDKVALLAGTEGAGLTEAALERAPIHAGIPMAPGVDSLNVATAVGIALFALRAARAAT